MARNLTAMVDLTVRRVYAGYFVVQALVGVGFWVLLAASPEIRAGFELLDTEHAVTDAFLFADVLVGIVGSMVAAWAILTGRRTAPAFAAFAAGGLTYATLYILAWVAFTGEGGVMLAIMVPPATLSCFVAHQVWRAWSAPPASG